MLNSTTLLTQLYEGLWPSRISRDGRVNLWDSGNTHHPIAIPATAGMTDVLEMLQAWHEQARMHALVQAPEILALQLNRFGPTSHGGTKVHTAFEVLYHTMGMGLELR